MSDVNHKLGAVINGITNAAKEHGVSPHSPIVCRVGKDGPEMQVEHVIVKTTIAGPKVILQLMPRN